MQMFVHLDKQTKWATILIFSRNIKVSQEMNNVINQLLYEKDQKRLCFVF